MQCVEIIGITVHPAAVADCQHCGQSGLRRVVRVRVDGDEMGVGDDCAAHLTGQDIRVVRFRAYARQRDADRAAQREWDAWNLRMTRFVLWQTDGSVRLYPVSEETARAEWLAENPEPPRPVVRR